MLPVTNGVIFITALGGEARQEGELQPLAVSLAGSSLSKLGLAQLEAGPEAPALPQPARHSSPACSPTFQIRSKGLPQPSALSCASSSALGGLGGRDLGPVSHQAPEAGGKDLGEGSSPPPHIICISLVGVGSRVPVWSSPLSSSC